METQVSASPNSSQEIIPLALYDDKLFTLDFIWLYKTCKKKENGIKITEASTELQAIKDRLKQCYETFVHQNSQLLGSGATDQASIPQVAFCSPEACVLAINEHKEDLQV